MRFFGKKKLSEAEAAGRFALMVTKGVKHHWPGIARELQEIFEFEEPLSDDQHAAFEFALAVIATQIQALGNLLPSEQARRIRQHIMQGISCPDGASYLREAIQEYQDAWDESLKQGELPIYGMASLLFDKLECRSTVEVGGVKFKDPLLLDLLSGRIAAFGGPWWKNITQQYKLVP